MRLEMFGNTVTDENSVVYHQAGMPVLAGKPLRQPCVHFATEAIANRAVRGELEGDGTGPLSQAVALNGIKRVVHLVLQMLGVRGPQRPYSRITHYPGSSTSPYG